MREWLSQLCELVGTRDFVEIAILGVAIYVFLRFLAKMRGWKRAPKLGSMALVLLLLIQLLITGFDRPELGRVLSLLVKIAFFGLLVVFQPELRRGLILLGRYRMLRYLVTENQPFVDKLADAAEALSWEHVGALIGIQREVALDPYVETGERIDAEISPALIRTVFSPRSPLHDGAMILCNGRICAVACQLPLGQPPEGASRHLGMRHRAALCFSEETDAVVLVVSEETGRISLAVGGRLEAVPRENLSRRLADMLSSSAGQMNPPVQAA